MSDPTVDFCGCGSEARYMTPSGHACNKYGRCKGPWDFNINDHQPAPKPSSLPAVWDLVLSDMAERDRIGASRYGTRLQPHNGRDCLVDAYQEALDLAVYLRQAIFERDGK